MSALSPLSVNMVLLTVTGAISPVIVNVYTSGSVYTNGCYRGSFGVSKYIQLSQVTPASSRCVQSLVPILLAGQSLMESSVPTQWTSSSKITPLPIPFPVVLALAPVL